MQVGAAYSWDRTRCQLSLSLPLGTKLESWVDKDPLVARLSKDVGGRFLLSLPYPPLHIAELQEITGLKHPECQRYHGSHPVFVEIFMTTAFKHLYLTNCADILLFVVGGYWM